MDAAAAHRAWVTLELGVLFLALAGLQLWAGRAFVGIGWRPSAWAYRKKEPGFFWFHVGSLAALGLFAVGLAAIQFL